MKSTVFFQTDCALYMYDSHMQNYTIAHPLILHYHLMDQKEKLPSNFSLMNENNLPKDFNQQDLEYYFDKYFYFKKSGYFVEEERTICRKFSYQNIESAFYNVDHVVFEITDACNLKCIYCGYGDMYYDHDARNDQYMKFDTIKCVLDKLCKFWKSDLNLSSQKNIVIGFYGGEPLLNFQLIKDTIEYINKLNAPNIRFKYNMTTNGTLLYKYIDYLVKNDFKILISLDGTEYNHSYRVFHDGKNSHSKILSNIKRIMNEYPQFYSENINYNAVLHNRNSVESINDFVQTELGKIPRINSLNDSGIKEENKKEFVKLYNTYFESINMSEKKDVLINDRFIDDTNVYGLSLFLSWFNNNQYSNYISFFNKLSLHLLVSTGTCMPFERKMYITVNNKILACEKISQEYVLGKIENNNVIIDFEQIENIYNNNFEKIYRSCKKCYNAGKCSQCIFQFNKIDEQTECHGFQNMSQFSEMLGRRISFLEKHPTLFIKIINEIFIQ